MEFQKGRKKAGRRKPGTPNKATDSIKNLLNRLLPEERLEREWNFFLKHADPIPEAHDYTPQSFANLPDISLTPWRSCRATGELIQFA
jgi:hypothetical protein